LICALMGRVAVGLRGQLGQQAEQRPRGGGSVVWRLGQRGVDDPLIAGELRGAGALGPS
jgi:hypothetical protein